MHIHLILSPSKLKLDDHKVNPEYTMPPLGLATIAGYLKKHNHQVQATDLNVALLEEVEQKGSLPINMKLAGDDRLLNAIFSSQEKQSKSHKIMEQKCAAIGEYLFSLTDITQPDVVGISILYDSQLPSALLLAKTIKEKTGATIVLGGYEIADTWGEEILKKTTFVDYIITGNGDLALHRICEAIEGKEQLEQVPGLLFLKDNNIVATTNQDSVPYEELPAPDFSIFNLARYQKLQQRTHIAIPYQFMKGCPFQCAFCRFAQQNSFSYKKPIQVREEIQQIKRETNNPLFLFLNNTYNWKESYALEVAKQLQPLHIIWSDSVRAKNISLATAKKMKQAGCVKVNLGIESTDDTILLAMNKQATATDAISALQNLHEAGIWNNINLIFGFPYQTKASYEKNIQFIKDNHQYIDSITIFKFGILQTDILTNPKKYHILIKNPFTSNELFDEINGRTDAEIKKQRDEYIEKTYAVAEEYNILIPTTRLANKITTMDIMELYKTHQDKKIVKEKIKEKINN